MIISSHQQIVKEEDSLHLTDGAQIISLLYKTKEMKNEVNSISYSFAVIEYVVKMLQLVSYESLEAARASLAESDAFVSYSRTREFLIYNSNSSLRIASEDIIEKYFDILTDKAASGKIVRSL